MELKSQPVKCYFIVLLKFDWLVIHILIFRSASTTGWSSSRRGTNLKLLNSVTPWLKYHLPWESRWGNVFFVLSELNAFPKHLFVRIVVRMVFVIFDMVLEFVLISNAWFCHLTHTRRLGWEKSGADGQRLAGSSMRYMCCHKANVDVYISNLRMTISRNGKTSCFVGILTILVVSTRFEYLVTWFGFQTSSCTTSSFPEWKYM